MGEPGTSAAKLRVLAADDNPVVRMVLEAMFARPDVDLCVVSDGQAAVEAWRTDQPHLVLLDIVMPVLDGLSAARRIRELEAELGRARTPIYALTGQQLAQLDAQLEEAGIDGLLPKPLSREQIGPLLARLCSD